jgi:hypothetical protein
MIRIVQMQRFMQEPFSYPWRCCAKLAVAFLRRFLYETLFVFLCETFFVFLCETSLSEKFIVVL